MNKIIKTFAVLMAGIVLTAGTAVAAPHHGWGHRPHCPPPPPRHHVVHHGGGNAGWKILGTGPKKIARKCRYTAILLR